jgi:hypothetical protein
VHTDLLVLCGALRTLQIIGIVSSHSQCCTSILQLHRATANSNLPSPAPAPSMLLQLIWPGGVGILPNRQEDQDIAAQGSPCRLPGLCIFFAVWWQGQRPAACVGCGQQPGWPTGVRCAQGKCAAASYRGAKGPCWAIPQATPRRTNNYSSLLLRSQGERGPEWRTRSSCVMGLQAY